MRIAYVTETYPPELNGVALTVARTVAFLRQRGHVVDLIRPRQPADAASAGRGDAHEWLTAGMPIPMYPELRFGWATERTLRARFARTQPDLVHVATPGPLAWSALRAARRAGLPVTSDFRTNFHQYSGYYRLGLLTGVVLKLLRRFHNATAKTFVPTREVAEQLAGEGFERLSVVGRGVDGELFNPAHRSQTLRETWGAHGDAPVLLSVGRVAAEKNIGLTLRSFEAVRRMRPQAQMVVIGDGPLRAKLQAAHTDVRFLGVRRGEDLAACYASADLFVFPSLSETFGNVTLEALASGLPVVAYDTAAAAEHVKPEISGLLVRPGDEAGFEAAVCDMACAPRRLTGMRGAAAAAGRQARWPEILGRFESELQHTVDVFETSPATAAVLA